MAYKLPMPPDPDASDATKGSFAALFDLPMAARTNAVDMVAADEVAVPA